MGERDYSDWPMTTGRYVRKDEHVNALEVAASVSYREGYQDALRQLASRVSVADYYTGLFIVVMVQCVIGFMWLRMPI